MKAYRENKVFQRSGRTLNERGGSGEQREGTASSHSTLKANCSYMVIAKLFTKDVLDNLQGGLRQGILHSVVLSIRVEGFIGCFKSHN